MAEVPDMRSIPPVFCVTLGANEPVETCRVGTAFAQASSAWAKSKRCGAHATGHSDDFAHPTDEDAPMHKIAINKANAERLQMRLGKLHPFDVLDPAKTALVVIDMQNYFVKQGHQSEVPAAREIVPNINRLAAELRRRGGHVVWVRNGTNDTRESWSNYHNYLQSRDRAERRLKSMEIGEDGYEYWHLNDIRPEDTQITKKRYSAFIQGSSDLERHLRDRGIDTILVTGTATNVCCESTARDAMMLNFKVVMVADGLATHTDEEHNATLSNFYGQFGDVQTVDEAVESLQRGAKKAAA
jgi:nicotinamidase-related amidase